MGWAGAPFPEQYGGAGVGMSRARANRRGFGTRRDTEPAVFDRDRGRPAAARRRDGRRSATPGCPASPRVTPSSPRQSSSRAAAWRRRRLRTTHHPRRQRLQDQRHQAVRARRRGGRRHSLPGALGRTAVHDLTLLMVSARRAGSEDAAVAGGGRRGVVGGCFDGVSVDADAVVGEPGDTWRQVERLLLRGAAFKSAELVGIGQASLDLTLSYAKTRIQFGRPIGSFQGVQHHCAEMYRDLAAQPAADMAGDGRAGRRPCRMLARYRWPRQNAAKPSRH